jgi:acyl-CoA dehydrogenase
MSRMDRERLAELAASLAAEFAANASLVDDAAQFPQDNVGRLRDSGMLGLLVPAEYGGLGGGVDALVDVAKVFGGACTSTAMIFAMHCQQVAVVAKHAGPALRDRVLPDIAAGRCLLGSITTEAGNGGQLLSVSSPLLSDVEGWLLERDAPVVTGGMAADAYLVTMRTAAERPANDVTLAFVDRSSADVEFRSGWSTMGMRGTESVGIKVKAPVRTDDLIGGAGGFGTVARTTMIPVGHLAWSAVWLGAARGAFSYVLSVLRDPGRRSRDQVASDLSAHNLARIRLSLDVLSAYLQTCVDEFQSGADPSDAAYHIHSNNLKVLASEISYDAVNQMVSLLGLRLGYARTAQTPLERVLRDLRAASLMYANDRLLVANGKLALIDRAIRLSGEQSAVSASLIVHG